MPVIAIVTLREIKDFKIHQNSSGKILQIFYFIITSFLCSVYLKITRYYSQFPKGKSKPWLTGILNQVMIKQLIKGIFNM